MTTNKDVESADKTIEQLAVDLADIIRNPQAYAHPKAELVETFIKFAQEIKREAIEP